MYIYIYLLTLKYNWKIREINKVPVPVTVGAVALLAGMLARPGLASLILCLSVVAVTLAGVTALIT